MNDRRCLLLLLAVAGALWSPVAPAQQCRFAGSGNAELNFGTIDQLPTTGEATAGQFDIRCDDVPAEGVKLCLGIDAGTGGAGLDPRQMRRSGGAEQLDYRITRDPAGVQPWGPVGTADSAVVIIERSAGGSGSAVVPLYGQLVPGASPAAGDYLSGLTATLEQTSNRQANCNSGRPADSMRFDAIARIAPACTITTTSLVFAATSRLQDDQFGTASINVQCPLGVPYKVGLNEGLNGLGGNPPARRMVHGQTGSDYIRYDLYRDSAYTLPWGSVASGNFAQSIGSGTPAAMTVFGVVPAGQGPLPTGRYSDRVTVTVEY
ncbi:MAG: spore coat U domain-containing protein [Proteobacteria bacterium]|nr:spore coat U domain-containing protein [Pseudomonadota bacterium]